jgi:tRNA-dihydrouridine synthase
LDKYFIPFLEPHEKRDFNVREMQEILPEHNEGMYAVPQILTNQADGFIRLWRALREIGYEEVNLNLGCPSKTVVNKQKGSGFLAVPDELDRFLDAIFSEIAGNGKISIKTRIGKDDPEEFAHLLEIFNQYPLEELIIHPRVQADYYNNEPRMEAFELARAKSRNPLCYNGDLFTDSRIDQFQETYPEQTQIMLGRGLMIHPGLVYERKIRQNQGNVDSQQRKERFQEFHDRLILGYQERDLADESILHKMKELWFYQIHMFPQSEKYAKQIKKTQKFGEYRQIVAELLKERDMCPLP